MKYYKLIKNAIHYPSFTPNKIYPESFAPRWCSVSDHYKSNLNNGSWIEVPAGDYFVQEGVMPEYFAIERDKDNPLWQKYINWLNTTYNSKYEGDSQDYYGFDGKTDYFWKLSCFKNNPIELTLEQWDKIVNKTMEEEFKLQKVWFIQLTEENKDLIEKWHRKICMVEKNYDIDSFYGVFSDGTGDAWNSSSLPKNTQVITTEQFIKYVLNKEVMEENKEIIGWKLKENFKQYEKAAVDICKAQGSTEINDFKDDDGCAFTKNSNASGWLRKAGVLELWFEPVHKEKTLKFGGYDVTFEKATSGVRISCNGETGTVGQIEKIYNIVLKKEKMMFGSQEVKEITYSNDTLWSRDSLRATATSIKIGCTTGDWDEFVAIYEKAKSML